jgi:hypothetical protein
LPGQTLTVFESDFGPSDLARFIGRCRALGRMDEMREKLTRIGEQAQQGEWSSARAQVAYAELEAEVFPARRSQKQKVEEAVVDGEGRLLATVASPDRSNLVVRGAEAWAEDDWKEFTIGEVRFKAAKPCGRCQITTTDQATGEVRGPEPLATLSTFRDSQFGVLFGVNLIALTGGMVRTGDRVVLQD